MTLVRVDEMTQKYVGWMGTRSSENEMNQGLTSGSASSQHALPISAGAFTHGTSRPSSCAMSLAA